MAKESGRHVVGALFVDLLKFCKNLERTHGAKLPLPAETRKVLERRVSITEWVPLSAFLDLIAVVDELVLRGDEDKALEMGAAGGTAMRGLFKAYVVPDDPVGSVVAMRHAWRTYYDFGRLHVAGEDASSVTFALDGYPEIPMVHGLLTVGWGVATARAAGAKSARAVIRSRPWRDGQPLVYMIGV